jgi:hypothetical protein
VFKKVPFVVFAATILMVLLIQPCLPAYAGEPKSECWAVIVGVADYKMIEDVNYSDDDARELAQQLSPVWGQDHIKLLLDREATKTNVRAAIDWLADKDSADDTVLFYFSGHGSSDGYIAPYNAYYADTWISRSELGGWLDKLDSQNLVVVLDTCRAGLYQTTLGGDGRVVLMSSRSGEDAWETSAFKHTVFTYYILQALDEFADANHNYELSAEEIFQYAEPETVSLTTTFPGFSTQHPVLSDSYPGELSLLVQCLFSPEPSLPSGTVALFVDNQPYSSGSPPLIWAPGSAHELRVLSLADTGRGTRYLFVSWDDGDTSLSRTTSNGGVYGAKFQTEYQLTIESAYGEPEGGGWYQESSTAAISVASIEEAGVRHIFTGWSGDFTGTETTAAITMDSPKAITANWRTDYLLTIESAYGEPEGGGWYQESSTATISVAPVAGVIIRHIFTGWSGDFTGTETTAAITMDSPKTIKVIWLTDYTQLYILVAVVVILVSITVIVRTRRRKNL